MLKIQFKDKRAASIALEAPGKTIGSGAVNDIVIKEAGVSSFHADLQVDGDDIIITDVNTETGTLVNGDKIVGPVILKVGDQIAVAGVELEIIDAEDSDPMEGKTLVLSGTALLELGSGGWSLVADSGPEKGQVIPVMEKIIIGRALECDISILEPGLSRKHAELDVIGDELILEDLGSSNGTFVNGEKIGKISLDEGDVMQFDKVKFIVRAP